MLFRWMDMKIISFKVLIVVALLLIASEPNLSFVEGQGVASDPNYTISRHCSVDSDCRCSWFWQHPKCNNGSCTCSAKINI
ncbi:hypothetical protein Hanom_Chr11g01005791 [Helianthus anomalus]